MHSVLYIYIYIILQSKEEAVLEKQQRRKAVGGPSFTKASDVSL